MSAIQNQSLFQTQIRNACLNIQSRITGINNINPSEWVTIAVSTPQTYVIPSYNTSNNTYSLYINGLFKDSSYIKMNGHRFTGYYSGGLMGSLPGKIPYKKPCPSSWTSNGITYTDIRDDGTTCFTKPYGRGVGRSAVHIYGKGCCCTAWGCCGCRSGYTDDGCTCRRDACNADEQWIASMCYPKCKAGYSNAGCCICQPDQGFTGFMWLWDRQQCEPGYANFGGLCYAPPGTSSTGWYTQGWLYYCNDQLTKSYGYSNTIYFNQDGTKPYIQIPPLKIDISPLTSTLFSSSCTLSRNLPFDLNIVADTTSPSGYSLNLKTGNINLDMKRIMLKLKPFWFNIRFDMLVTGTIDVKLPIFVNTSSPPANSILILNTSTMKMYLPINGTQTYQTIAFDQIYYILMQITDLVAIWASTFPCGMGSIVGMTICALQIFKMVAGYDPIGNFFIVTINDIDPLSWFVTNKIVDKLTMKVTNVEEDACFIGWTKFGVLSQLLQNISNVTLDLAQRIKTKQEVEKARAYALAVKSANMIAEALPTAGICTFIDMITAFIQYGCTYVDLHVQAEYIKKYQNPDCTKTTPPPGQTTTPCTLNPTADYTIFKNILCCILPSILNSIGINQNISYIFNPGSITTTTQIPVTTPSISPTNTPSGMLDLPNIPTIVGTTISNTVFYTNQNISTRMDKNVIPPTGPTWKPITSDFIWTTASNGRFYGLKSNGILYYSSNNSSWTPVPGPSGVNLVQISFDNFINPGLMGIGSNQSIWYANQNLFSSPNWTQIGGSLTNVSYSNGQAYGCNQNGIIYYASNVATGNWVQIPGSLNCVSFDGYSNIVIGSNRTGSCFYSTNAKVGNFVQMNGGGITNISYCNGQMACVSGGNIFFASNYNTANWVVVNDSRNFKQVTFSDPNTYVYKNYVQLTNTAAGTDLPSQPVPGNLYDCQRFCDNNPSCIGFSRLKSVNDTQNSYCYLKKSVTPTDVTFRREDVSWGTYIKPGKMSAWP